MAISETKTKWILEYEGKNAEKLQQTIDAMAGSLAPEKISGGFKQLEHYVARSQRQMRGMETMFKAVNQSLFKFKDSVESINQIAKGFDKAAKSAEDLKDNTKKAGDEAKKSSRFLQGMFQGLGVGEYIPSGPGMGRQIAGRMVGGGIRRGAGLIGGAAMQPVMGTGALAQGLSGIPGVGPALAAQLQQAQGLAQRAIQFQRTSMQTMIPFVGVGRAMVAGGAAAERALPAGFMGARAAEAGYQAARKAAIENVRRPGIEKAAETVALASPMGGAPSVWGSIFARREAERASASRPVSSSEAGSVDAEVMRQIAPGGAGDRAYKAKMAEMQTQRRTAYMEAARANMRRQQGFIRRTGRQFGAMDPMEAMQAAGEFQQAGGEAVGGRESAFRSAMAAQTVFGVGIGTAGAFVRGARRGGILGAGGPDAGIGRALESAVRAGMDATEVRRFMESMAQGQEEFLRTGIPINPRSMAEIAGGIGGMGLGVGRGQAMAGGLRGALTGIARGGPKTAGQFLALREFGGYRGGGLGQLEEAQLRLEEVRQGTVTPEKIMNVMRTITEGAGEATAGRFAIRNVFEELGMPMGIRETRLMQRQAMGETLDPMERYAVFKAQEQMEARAKEAPKGAKGLQEQASGAIEMFGNLVKRQASIEDRRLTVGRKLVTSIQNLDSAMTTGAEGFAQFGGEMSSATAAINDFASVIPKITKALKMLPTSAVAPHQTDVTETSR